jgi:iron complex transport system ATP-binding protein
MNALLQTKNLHIGYQSSDGEITTIAKDLNLSLQPGQLTCLLGPNGAGKSTLLRTLCGIQKPLEGETLLSGQSLTEISPSSLARKLAVVLTDHVEVECLCVEDLVALGRYPYTNWTGKLHDSDWKIIDEMIDLSGLEHLRKREISQLSDGERQNCMIARALAQQPCLICLDEPTAFLDLPRKIELLSTLRRFSRETGRTFLLSAHDLELAMGSADTLWILNEKGKMYLGTPEELVLNGIVAATFETDEVYFNEVTGTFRQIFQGSEKIQVTGEGRLGYWTGRALERIGFQVSKDSASRRVSTETTQGGILWILYDEGKKLRFEALQELLTHLESRVL